MERGKERSPGEHASPTLAPFHPATRTVRLIIAGMPTGRTISTLPFGLKTRADPRVEQALFTPDHPGKADPSDQQQRHPFGARSSLTIASSRPRSTGPDYVQPAGLPAGRHDNLTPI